MILSGFGYFIGTIVKCPTEAVVIVEGSFFGVVVMAGEDLRDHIIRLLLHLAVSIIRDGQVSF